MTSQQSLGLVVVGYDSTKQWSKFFRSLSGSTLKPGSVVVVDNSPTDTVSLDRGLWPGLRLIRLPHNPGYGTASNVGIRALPGKVKNVVISNPDVEFTPKALETLLAAFDCFPKTAIVGPEILDSKGKLYPSARAIPGIRLGAGHAILGAAWPSNPWTKRYLGDYKKKERKTVGWLSGAIFMVKRDAFEEVEGFDENYFMFFEDVDLCHRLKRLGYRSVYVPDAQVIHDGGRSTSPRMRGMVKAHHESALYFLSNLYPHPAQAMLRLLLRVGLALRSKVEQAKYR